MDALEEVAGGPNQQLQDLSHIVKGKRTKRSRSTPHSPISFTMITATTTPPHSPPAGDAADNAATSAPIPAPPTPEDEDMARCLMLLSQGGGGFSRHPPPAIPKSPIHKEEEIGGAYNNTGGAWNNNGGAYNNGGGAWNNGGGGGGSKFCSKKYIETTTGGGGGGGGVKVGMYVYECRTCGRTFPTFQALGGHRTSHTKEKAPLTTAETGAAKRPLALYDEEDVNPYPFNKAPKISSAPYHFYDSANKSSPRIHECSYCGAEFSSGQALGGHMRRHRNSAPAAAASPLSPSSSSLEKRVPQKEENNGKCLNLDLNLLPAGEENQDHRRARELPENQEQQPPPVEPTLFLSTTPPLVGCKYI
nr:zinc finger protein ZAT5-like [Ipomoea trifida]